LLSPVKLALRGVMGDSPVVSVVATDRFRILRLVEERFFLTAGGGNIFPGNCFPGDGGWIFVSSILPWEPPCVNAGVAGDSLRADSVEGNEVSGVIGSNEPSKELEASKGAVCGTLSCSFGGSVLAFVCPSPEGLPANVVEFRRANVSILSWLLL